MTTSDGSPLDDLVSRLSIPDLAARLGSDPAKTREAVTVALHALLGGMSANVHDPAGEASLARAVAQHPPLDAVTVGDVDPTDGEAITQHVFGDAREQVVQRLGGINGLDKGLVTKLLPILAPLVMSYLAKRVGGAAAGNSAASGGGVLGQVLQSALRGAESSGASGGPAPSILDVLGGLLGSGRRH
ncbi:DUF937 domain-containing protein [Nocardioides yefusunii]|uniref:DUF937 domain-containing protein n=1 Tax=Nocardioides yefusunii TaxID=2500546 RepID=A0ABW1QX42_9ACTN|nr:DUF937 domain-containing protein [Nocardioides yefusunii]